MAERDLKTVVGTMEYENLIAGLYPPAVVKAGYIAHGDEEVTYKRGSLLARTDDNGLILFGSDWDESGTFSATGDGVTTRYSLVSGGKIPYEMRSVKVNNVAMTSGWSYNSKVGVLDFDTAPANSAIIAVTFVTCTYNPDCVLAEDVTVGTDEYEVVPVYVSGCFNPHALITAHEEFWIDETAAEILRAKGILLAGMQDPAPAPQD